MLLLGWNVAHEPKAEDDGMLYSKGCSEEEGGGGKKKEKEEEEEKEEKKKTTKKKMKTVQQILYMDHKA